MKRPAFTILELLIALTLFMVGMMSILQIFPANRKLLSQTTHNTQAAFLAQEALEESRTVVFDNLTPGNYVPRGPIPLTAGTQYSMFERAIVVENLDTNRAVTATNTGLKRVTVSVYWFEGIREQVVTATTYVTR